MSTEDALLPRAFLDRVLDFPLSENARTVVSKLLRHIDCLETQNAAFREKIEERSFAFGDVVLKPLTGELKGPRGSVYLPAKTCKFLVCLIKYGGHLVNDETLSFEVWPERKSRNLDTAIHVRTYDLRESLCKIGSKVRLETKHKEGLRLNEG